MKKTIKYQWKRLCFLFAALVIGLQTWAQVSITGIVVDEEGQTLPGVAVILKGTVSGTVTNVDGIYTITAPADGTLVFSFVGMQTVVEPINQRTTVNVTMKMDVIGLEEVVTVGYGIQKKATMTGAVGSVKTEELLQRPVANTTELLQGQVAGLITRQASGLPGSDGTILNIRGFGDNPLVLIDGIEGSLGQVDANDIENVSVLKDASAAVYGARAGNGVILVTTKRGKSKPSQITYHGTFSMTQPTFLPNLVGAREWAELLSESGLNPDNYSPKHLHYDPETKRLINTLDNSDFAGYDWGEALYKDWAPQQQHNVSATGGSDKIKYFLSAGFTDQESAFKSGEYDFNRYNIRSNIDAEITKDLGISLDLSYRTTILDKANFTEDNMYNSLLTAKPVYPIVHEADPNRAATSGFLQRSPYYQTIKEFTGVQENRDYAIQGGLELRYSIPNVEGLVAKARLNFEQLFSWDKTVNKPFDVWEYDPIAANAGNDPWIKWGTQNSNDMKVFSDRTTLLVPLVSLEYEKTLGNHNLKGVLVGESRTYNWTSVQGTRKDILSFEAPYLIYASEEGKDNGENLNPNGTVGITQRARTSFIGRLNYDYLRKYLFEFAMRADASAEYPPEGRWGYFPSFSAGWRISEESFIKDNLESVNNLKLRASYGIMGNDAISSFDYLTGYTISTDFYVYGTTPAPIIASAGIANPNITWETMKISNIGLDGNFWDGLLGFEIDAFYRLREGILAQPIEQFPSTFGASLPRTNLNKRDNRGIEIVLTHTNKIGNFSYDISPIFSWSRGKYVELDENVLPVTGDLDEATLEFNRLWNERYVNEGQWDDRVWGYVSDGFFMNQQQITDHLINQDQAANKTLKVGDLIYKDLNGDNLIDWRDQQIIGKSGLPKTMYSLDMGVQYKGFSLRMLWLGGADYIVTIAGAAAAPFLNESIPIEQHYSYRAIIGKDADGKDYITNPDKFKLPPVTQNGSTANNSKTNDFWTYNAAFLRLKNINFSYSLPKNVLQTIGFQNCIIYFSGTNLFSISNLGIWKDSYDPEIPWANNMHYPPVKTATFGLRFTL
jgi:TonB-linked SusC/RagA family outer membrane protein